MAIKLFPGDWQRDADARLAVKIPVSRARKEWYCSESESQQPGQARSQLSMKNTEAQKTQWKPDNKEAVDCYETDDER